MLRWSLLHRTSPYDRSMSPRQTLFTIAALLLLGGLVFGLVPRSVSDSFDGQNFDCGSLFSPQSSVGQIEDDISGSTIQSTCSDKRSGMKVPTYGALGLAVVALIVAFVASDSRPNRPTPP